MTRRILPALLLALLVCALAFAAPDAPPPPDPAGFLPAADAPRGFPEAGEILTFERGRLHEYLDGGADVLEEYGLERAAVREWTGEERALAVQVYRMKDDVGAFGVASFVRGPGSRAPAYGDGGFETDRRIGVVRGRWYAQIDVQQGGEEVLAEARRLARATADRLPGRGAEPALLAVVRTPTVVARSEVLLRGPLALASAEPFGKALATEGFLLAAGARYRRGESRARGLVADYASEDAARAAFGALARALGVDDEPGAMVVVARDGRDVVAWPDGHLVRVVIR